MTGVHLTYSSRHHRVCDSIHCHDAGAECQYEEDYLYQYEAGGEPEHVARTEQDAGLRTGEADERTGGTEVNTGGAAKRVGGTEGDNCGSATATRGVGSAVEAQYAGRGDAVARTNPPASRTYRINSRHDRRRADGVG